ncbi:CHAT domain-containing protein [Cryptosporangium minutisporangium]|uniref:CHAT domain-containing protein n=1 Tax=Cryptosporangium minutisporangium TaxID=113569 RepID=A0ABP6SV89_9ACTN
MLPLSVDDLAVVLRALEDPDPLVRDAAAAVLRQVPVGPDVIRAAAGYGLTLFPPDDAPRAAPAAQATPELVARAEQLRRQLLDHPPRAWPWIVRSFVEHGPADSQLGSGSELRREGPPDAAAIAGRAVATVGAPTQILALIAAALVSPDAWQLLAKAASTLTGVPPDPAPTGDDRDEPYEALTRLFVLVETLRPPFLRGSPPGPMFRPPPSAPPSYEPQPLPGYFPSPSAPPDAPQMAPPRRSWWQRWRERSRAPTPHPREKPDRVSGTGLEPVVQRSVCARLDAPDAVAPGVEFAVLVGLGASPQAGVVSAGFEVPAGPFTLGVQVLAEGFRVLGEGLSRLLPVTDADPYPVALVRLVAEEDLRLRDDRALQAVYSLDGQIIGVASRTVHVVRPASAASAPAPANPAPAGPPLAGPAAAGPPPPLAPPSPSAPAVPSSPAAAEVALVSGLASGVDWVLPSDPKTQPDLEVIVAPGNDTAGHRLVWYLRSPHSSVPLPSEPIRVLTGGTNAEWARGMMRGVEDRRDAADRAQYLRGIGYEIRQAMPEAFWVALRAIADLRAPQPPTVLLASWEPFVPWELAIVDDPWDAEYPDVLGAQTVLGRWTYQEQHRTPAPPAALDLDRMAVITGRYERAPRLPEAEAEAKHLAAWYGAQQIPAQIDPVLAVLAGRPSAHVVHVALHGQLDVTGSRDGLLMLDGSWLSPRSVRGVGQSPIRLAFLNACQVGQGQQALGEPTGMAAALIGIGAGAVVAPLWKVDDGVARTVAEQFYPAVWAGQSPAAFLRRIRGTLPGTETVSAYVYFGHPRLLVWWRGRDRGA